MLVVLGASAFTFGLLTAVAAQLSALDPYHQHQTQQNTVVYASDGHTVLAVLRGSQARVIVPSEDISPLVKQAMVAIEDKRFYEHNGVDVHGILRALWSDLTGGPVEGGSTITQQFVKNAINGNAPTLTRKLKEAALAWKLEQPGSGWSKDRILTAYLNTIYFGNSAYGVQEASKIYFGHGAKTLTPAEAALLAGIPANPSLYDPVAHPMAMRERRDVVLQQMFLQHYINGPELKDALNTPPPSPESVRQPATQSPAAPYFANYVTNQLVERYGARHVFGGGMKVVTTVDLGLQKIAREAIDKVLPPSIGPSAALVAIDVHTGQVVAMIGGRNFRASQFNLATQGERQPGSAFKPFVLATALRDGIAPSSILVSHPVVLDAGGRAWSVTNFEHNSMGPINLNTAIAYSDNTVFAQLTNIVGPGSVADTAAQMGITSPLHSYFSIGLGAEPATPVEMARAYTTLANGGYRLDSSMFHDQPNAVRSITFPSKNPSKPNPPTSNTPIAQAIPWLTNGNAAIEDQMLQGVVQYGTGTAAQLPGWQVAGKTGTTENYGDAWFVGYTPDMVTAVWVGYPNKLIPMTTEYHGHTVEGGTFPAEIWKAFMEKAISYRRYDHSTFPTANVPYASTARVIFRDGRLQLDNGNCRGAATLEFFSGKTPAATAPCKPNEVEVPDVRGATLEDAKTRLIGQPLLSTVVYAPAKPGRLPGIVVGQSPVDGTLSAYQRVRLVVSRAVYGVVPKVVGLSVARARQELAQMKLRSSVGNDVCCKVVAQDPPPGRAATPGMRVILTLHAS